MTLLVIASMNDTNTGTWQQSRLSEGTSSCPTALSAAQKHRGPRAVAIALVTTSHASSGKAVKKRLATRWPITSRAIPHINCLPLLDGMYPHLSSMGTKLCKSTTECAMWTTVTELNIQYPEVPSWLYKGVLGPKLSRRKV